MSLKANKNKTNKNKKLGKEAAGLMREIERRITKTTEFKKSKRY